MPSNNRLGIIRSGCLSSIQAGLGPASAWPQGSLASGSGHREWVRVASAKGPKRGLARGLLRFHRPRHGPREFSAFRGREIPSSVPVARRTPTLAFSIPYTRKGNRHVYFVVFRGRPRGRRVDCSPKRFAVFCTQSALPNGAPRFTHRRTASNSADVKA